MNAKFRIPDRIEELEDEENFSDYYLVRNTYQSEELEPLISSAEERLRNEGPDFILEEFDMFFYVIKHFPALPQTVRDKAWLLLYRALAKFATQLEEFYENFQLDRKLEYQNKLQMLTYLFLTISEFYEEEDLSLSSDIYPIGESIGRGKKKKNNNKDKSQIYQNYRHQSTNTILKIFSLHLERLFDPPRFLHSFVNIVTKYIYKMLENSNLLRAQPSIIFQNVCSIIGVAVDKYDHSLNFCMKIIQLLQAKETLVVPLSQLVSINIRGGHSIYIHEILQQIKQIDISILSKDNSAPKAISNFLIELSKNCTEKMFQNLSYLVEFLEHDSYTLRNGVLEIISHIILQMFQSPATNRDVQIKNKLLDYMYEHIHDVNSYTRSKVLQLWSKLAEAGTIPVDRLNQITKRIVDRLDDRSCFVRKNAVHFLTQSIKDNPFMILRKKELAQFAELTQKVYQKHRAELEEIQDKQLANMDELMKLSGEGDDAENASNDSNASIESNKENVAEPAMNSNSKRLSDEFVIPSANKRQKMLTEIQNLANEWAELQDKFLKFWNNTGNKLDLSEQIPDDIPQDSVEAAFEFFRSLVKECEFEKALRVLLSLRTIYPNDKMLQYKRRRNDEQGSSDELEMDEDEDNSQPPAEAFAVNDYLFLSTLLNFAVDFNEKLPYELELARLVFLAPIITFGNAAIESDDLGDNKKNPGALSELLTKHREELDSAGKDIEKLEKILNHCGQILHRLKEAEKFIEMLSESVMRICQLLQSKNIADVQEAINFFTFAFKLDLSNSIVGIQKMLKLIFTKEKAIKDRLLEAFVEIYLNESEAHADNQENEMDEEEDISNVSKMIAFHEIKNLSNMILKLNQGELVCAEALIKEIYLSKKITQLHLQVLWERYAMKLSRTTEEEARAALIIIGMLASANPSLVQNESNLKNLIEISLNQRQHDYQLVADTCEVLIRTFQLPSTESGDMFYKLSQDHDLFLRLQIILIDSITNTENKYWNRMASAIIKVIYFFAQKPDPIIAHIIEATYKRMMNTARASDTDGDNWDALCSQNTASEAATGTEVASSQLSTQNTNVTQQVQVNDVIVAHFISLLGNVAINLLIHLDLHLMREIKIRQFIQDNENQKKKDQKAKKANKKSRTSSKRSTISEEGDEDDFMGSTSNEDPMQELVTKTCNEHVLYGKGMLARFTDFVERIAADYEGAKYSLIVRLAASLTLSKFMVLSLRFTREKRSVLANLLDKAKDWEIRSNAIISFGDLLVRFPNEFEHYSGKIFSCLNDGIFTVRINALKVLTRLILADMVKPKGQISKIARLITDSNPVIKDSAQLFFIELGKKNNVYIYNFLPDIISNLSGTNGMQEELFKEMIKFLFERLEKTRNTESLVAKLCQRFRDLSDERTWRDLSFCLSQITYNERALVNLMNNFNLFGETVRYDPIHDNFMTIVNTARKMATLKQETKQLLDDLENRMKEVRAKGIEQSQQNQDENSADGDVNGAATGEDQNDSQERMDNELMPPPVVPIASSSGRPRRGQKATTTTQVSNDDDDDSPPSIRSSRSSARQTQKKAQVGKKTEKGTKAAGKHARSSRRRVVHDSDSDSGDDTYEFEDE